MYPKVSGKSNLGKGKLGRMGRKGASGRSGENCGETQYTFFNSSQDINL